MAIDLSSRLGGDNAIFSLEMSEAEMAERWPWLATQPLNLVGFSKKSGIEPTLILRLAKQLKAWAPYAVLTHHIGPMFYGCIAARLAGVPVIAHVEHDVWHYGERNDRRIARLMDTFVHPHVVAVSDTVAEAMRKLMPSSQVSVIRNAVDTERFSPSDRTAARARLGLPQDARIVGAAGRLEDVKGQDVLLEAMAQVPDALLVLAGDGSKRGALEAQAARLGLADRVIFLGYRSDMETVYPAFDLAVLPSRNEGLPLSVLEAQACDIPMVATDVGSVREGLAPGASRLVPSLDPAAMAAAITDLLAHPPGTRPRAFVTEHFSWERMVTAYRRLLTPPVS
ncbi:glycosyl transferase [Azorhizobium oxalatiphilum]|uniref:Glycosyl transferase n=1 Tax=Azorhizobium oxalatiphilum TaxID=980631 RepID=A0A917C7I2_9HYPH|nr:glycosyl transferase [Azorhizobium oxalatiphilum]